MHRAVPPVCLRKAPIFQSPAEQRLRDGALAGAFGPQAVALVQQGRLPRDPTVHFAFFVPVDQDTDQLAN